MVQQYPERHGIPELEQVLDRLRDIWPAVMEGDEDAIREAHILLHVQRVMLAVLSN